MRKFGILLMASMLVLPSAFAKKGGGASNGGNAILCEGKSAEMIDTFLEHEIQGSDDRTTFRKDILARLNLLSADLAQAWVKEWDRIGDSENWAHDSSPNLLSFDEYLPYDLKQIRGCQAIQIASFTEQDYTPKKARGNYERLSRFQRRVLELHESLFIVGVRDYSHTNPVMTRDLIAELLARNFYVERARMLAEDFTKRVVSEPTWHRDWAIGTSGIYTLESGSIRDFCPSTLVFEDTRVGGSHLIADFTARPKAPKNPLLTVRLGETRTYLGINQSVTTRMLSVDEAQVTLDTPAYQFHMGLSRHSGDFLSATFVYRTPDDEASPQYGQCDYRFQSLDVFEARERIRSRIRAERLQELVHGRTRFFAY